MSNTCITSEIIGISQEPCDCYTDELNDITPTELDWYKKSTSGLYLDELESEGLVSMRAADGSMACDKTLGKFYKESVIEAIKKTIDDTYFAINSRFAKKHNSFSGKIGGNRFNRTWVIPNAGLAGVLLSPKPMVDGVFKMNKLIIGASVNATGIEVSIFRIYPDLNEVDPELVTVIEDVNLMAGKSTIKDFTEPILLPMEVEGERVQYLIVRELQEGEEVPNTSPSCGCGKKEVLFNTYATFKGITIDNNAESFEDYSVSSYTNGFSLEGEFSCASEAIICRMFYDEAFKKVFAYAVLYLAGAKVNTRVILSDEINRWNMINFDDAKATAANFMAEYESRITWLSQNTNPEVNDCYSCGNRNTLQMKKASIIRNG